MNNAIITCTNLCKTYGLKKVVNNVSFEIPKGSICGLVGKNGAGKTTLIRVLMGLAPATSGSYEVCRGIVRTSTTVAAIVERPSIYRELTAVDNLVTQCKLLGITPDYEYIDKTLKLVGLSSSLATRAKDYSLGMQQRLAVAMTIVGKPELLILDEPTNGLDPQGIKDMRELFVKLNRDYGTTLVISSHILSELGKFATHYIFMDNGKVLKTATAEDLAEYGEKRMRLTVSDTEKALAVLKDFGKLKVEQNGTISLYGSHSVTDVVLALSDAKVTVNSLASDSDDLENYFINLVGGEQNV